MNPSIEPFAVDKVKVCKIKLRNISNYLQHTKLRLGSKVEAVGFGDFPVVKICKKNGFIEAVGMAFDKHYPLSIAPSHIWLLIAQGVAKHVELNAERLRTTFVNHEGKKKIEVRRDEFVKGCATNNWPEVFEEFSMQLQKLTKGPLAHQITQPFSTTSLVEKAALEISLMDSMKQYFDYLHRTHCGFPKIFLEGTVGDWQDLHNRATLLRSVDKESDHFGKWINEVTVVTQEFLNAAKGSPNISYWRSFFKINGGSGGPYITGWINVLFPYVADKENFYATNWDKGMSWDIFGGKNPEDIPTGLSTAPFVWNYYDESINMHFVAGFLSIEQIPATYAVRPGIGWAVLSESGYAESENSKQSSKCCQIL